jgi:molybdopterin-guanine dinucleotide biosynthesis protein A
MGSDKALLPHPDGGTWLERTLLVLAELRAPITLLSRWPEHLALAQELRAELNHRGASIETLRELPPWEGPLLALHRLMRHHPQQKLLLCPVDMPALNQAALAQLMAASDAQPDRIVVAHDGERCQPLLGIYPSDEERSDALSTAIDKGERRLQRWLGGQANVSVVLDPSSIRNVNHPSEREALGGSPRP